MALRRQKHASPPIGHGNDSVVDGRAYTLHPTKGWRCMRVADVRFDESKLHPLVKQFRALCRARGKLA